MELYEILQPIIESINNIVSADLIIDNANGTYTFKTKNTLWLRINSNVVIGTDKYKVVGFECNKELLLKGATLPTQTTFEIQRPRFAHGTIEAVNDELSINLTDANKVFPLAFLHETYKEKYNYNPNDTLGRECKQISFYFLSLVENEWVTDKHYANAIKPMRNVLDAFVGAINTSYTLFNRINNYDTVTHAKVGLYNMAGTRTKNLLDSVLSGLEMTFDLDVLKQCCECIDYTVQPQPCTPSTPLILVNDKYYEESFSGAISFQILGKIHNFGRVPNVQLYDVNGERFLAKIEIDYSTFTVTVTGLLPMSGKIILT